MESDGDGPPTPDELIEAGYRKEYPMTWWQLQDEPADAIWEWVMIENCRLTAAKQRN